MAQTGVVPFIKILDAQTLKPLRYEENFREYFSAVVQQEIEDFQQGDSSGSVSLMGACSSEDLYGLKDFEVKAGRALLCSRREELEQIVLRNSLRDLQQVMKMKISIVKCGEEVNQHFPDQSVRCKSDGEIDNFLKARVFEVGFVASEIDSATLRPEPRAVSSEILVLRRGVKEVRLQPLRHNLVHSRNSMLQLWITSKEDFFTPEQPLGLRLETSGANLAELQVGFSEVSSTHIISAYTVFDLCSFAGGLAILTYWLFSCLLAPLAEHSFFISAIQRLYLVHLSDQSVLKRHQPRPKTMEELSSAKVA